jgi:hypothetical protein
LPATWNITLAARYCTSASELVLVLSVFSPYERRFTVSPIFALGSLTLVVKAIFLHQELTDLSDSSRRKDLPSIVSQAAQVLQDFGTGSFLLWPLLNIGKDMDPSGGNPPRFPVFASGAILFFVGWLMRRFTVSYSTSSDREFFPVIYLCVFYLALAGRAARLNISSMVCSVGGLRILRAAKSAA